MNALKLLWIDLETTGTDPYKNGICQMSGILDFNGEEIDRFNYNICPFPECEYTAEALKVNRLTEDQIRTFQPESEVFIQLNDKLKSHIQAYSKTDRYFIAGYNISFDKEFLFKFFNDRNKGILQFLVWGNPIDVMTLASQRLILDRPNLKNFQLTTVAKYMGIEVDESRLHDAMYDIELTRQLYYLILKREFRQDEAKFNLIQSLQTAQVNPVKEETAKRIIKYIDDVLDFGKYRNRTIAEVLSKDPQYIIWIDKNVARLTIEQSIIDKAQDAIDLQNINKKPNHIQYNNDTYLDDQIDSNPGLMSEGYDYTF
ncbi:DNA polymerase III subunit epsilon [termite gut metagenome]|uniref:DNA polymerase III subunit epsilon n=1 Tax=termite gut metagenome TaxID=433724 RepID=A0A5J4QIV1_9ZZZZ